MSSSKIPSQAAWALSKHFVALSPSCLLRPLQPRIIKGGQLFWFLLSDLGMWMTLETLEGSTLAIEERLKAGASPCAMACTQGWGSPVIKPGSWPASRSHVAWSAPACTDIQTEQFPFWPTWTFWTCCFVRACKISKGHFYFGPKITCIFCTCCSVRSWGGEWPGVQIMKITFTRPRVPWTPCIPGRSCRFLIPCWTETVRSWCGIPCNPFFTPCCSPSAIWASGLADASLAALTEGKSWSLRAITWDARIVCYNGLGDLVRAGEEVKAAEQDGSVPQNAHCWRCWRVCPKLDPRVWRREIDFVEFSSTLSESCQVRVNLSAFHDLTMGNFWAKLCMR